MVQVLDCTLRDGGYYTDWDFDPDLVSTYMGAVRRLPVDFVEVGYVNDPSSSYFGEFYFLTPEKLLSLRAQLRSDQKLVVMIDGKNFRPERLGALFAPLASLVDLVRITVSPQALDHGLALAGALKAVGVSVGFNVMYLSTFQADLGQIAPALERADAFDSLALVDSFGGCTPDSVGRLFAELRQALPGKTIGFHGHDNMCLAFANTLAAIAAGADVVGGTFTGMGRGAGNLRTETALIHLAGRANRALDYGALSEAVAPFDRLRKVYEWGTNLPYMLSGANNLPQKDVMDWLGKNRYSVLSILQALQRQSGGDADARPFPALSAAGLGASSVLLIGGGESVVRHAEALGRFVRRERPLVVFTSSRHLGLSALLGGEQVLCLPGHDATRAGVLERLGGVRALVVPAPPRVHGCLPEGVDLPVFQAEPVHVPGEKAMGPVPDTGPLSLALGAVRELGVRECFLSGFDGYAMASAAEQDLAAEVEATLRHFRHNNAAIQLSSITPTRYRIQQASVYGLVAATN